jgi:hypothetical protein
MKQHVVEEEGIHTTLYEAKAHLCSRKLGQDAKCKMQQLWPEYIVGFLICISDSSYYKETKFLLHFFFQFLSKKCSCTADIILFGQQADKIYLFIYLAHR